MICIGVCLRFLFKSYLAIKLISKFCSDLTAGFKMCVPIGRDGGITQVKSKVFGDFLTKFIKAKDAFVKFSWKEFGQKPPQ